MIWRKLQYFQNAISKYFQQKCRPFFEKKTNFFDISGYKPVQNKTYVILQDLQASV